MRDIKKCVKADHLGSVRAVISGKKKSAGEVDISYLSDYYSNGVNSREYVTGEGRPRYLWQGMEWDMETKSYNTLFRFYSPEYGRWWSPDPVIQPWQSNYSAMDGNPIYYTDRLGLSKDGPGSGAKNTVKSKFGNAAGGGGRKPPGTNLQAKGIPRIAPNPGLRMASMVNSMNRSAVSAGKAANQYIVKPISKGLSKMDEAMKSRATSQTDPLEGRVGLNLAALTMSMSLEQTGNQLQRAGEGLMIYATLHSGGSLLMSDDSFSKISGLAIGGSIFSLGLTLDYAGTVLEGVGQAGQLKFGTATNTGVSEAIGQGTEAILKIMKLPKPLQVIGGKYVEGQIKNQLSPYEKYLNIQR